MTKEELIKALESADYIVEDRSDEFALILKVDTPTLYSATVHGCSCDVILKRIIKCLKQQVEKLEGAP